MEENKDLQLTRVESNENHSETMAVSTTLASPSNNVSNNKEINKEDETKIKEEEKKLSRSRQFILFVIADCILGIFLIAEIIWLFFDFFKKG